MKKAIVKKMISYIKKVGMSIGVASAIAGLPESSFSQSMNEYSALPPLSVQTQSQQSIMLAMSLDHQVFMKAYNDFSDLDKDGVPDNTYLPDYIYVGYFDPTLCYENQPYTGGLESHFIPVGRRDSDAEIPKCLSGQWSGNFLNWATMTRIDLVRQVLYGGYRYKDTATETILERSYLPHDAHSFAKYVPPGINLDGLAVVPASNTECDDANDPRCLGYTFCNTTRPPQANIISQNVNEPPLLRVVKGNYMLWDASERYQCLTTAQFYPYRNNYFDWVEENGVLVQKWGLGNNVDLIADTYSIGSESEAKPVLGELSGNEKMERDPSGANLNDAEKSGINAFSFSPLKENVVDYIARVSVCAPSHPPVVIGELEGKELYSFECESYQNNSKPIGLLQRYGTGISQYDVQFGLLSRSFDNNKGYGALRKNLASFIDEINVDGTFKSVEERPDSIVHNLDAIRIVDYLYQRGVASEWFGGNGDRGALAENSGTYRPSAVGHDVGCEWGQASFNPGTCRNWGNPFSQILAESFRYLTGAATANVSNERLIRSGISVAEWNPPEEDDSQVADQFSCSAKGVLGFNASSVSYDATSGFGSSTPNSLGVPGAPENSATLVALTNELGNEAGISGNYFVGRTSANTDGFCTVKSVTNLGEVTGTCPETPRLEGGYLGAGLAKYVLDEHKVRTFGVSLTDALARIRIPFDASNTDGPAVQIVPACHNQTTGGNCALVSFKVIEDVVIEAQDENSGDIPTATRRGSYYVAWEDTEQGGDYDVDSAGVIRYELLSNGSLNVETELLYNGTPDILHFGYVISGTSSETDGAIFPAETPGGGDNVSAMSQKDNSMWRPTRSWCNGSETSRCTPGGDGYYQRITYSSTAGSDANFLPSPLKLAATYGSGIGDQGHAEVDDPSQLRVRLDTILRGLFNELKPGTGAGVSTNAITGEGLILSSLYSPELVHVDQEENEHKVSWVGHLNGLFYKDGMFWENCHQPDPEAPKVITIDDCVVEIGLDEETQKTVFTRYKVTRDEEGVASINLDSKTGPFPYLELQSLWSADAELSSVDEPLTQRTYGTASDKRRHILTAIAADNSVNATSNDLISFEVDNFAENTPDTVGIGPRNYRMLGVSDPVVAQDIVKYIRGDETVPNSRSRTLDGKTWLLGDIVHSSAAVVGRPASNFDIDRIGDATYSKFVERYRNRRLVTYVGANDGMLHAFNGGFFNYNTDSPGYLKTPAGVEVTEHNLGAELWGYVPYNLLPHLKWLKDPDYSHVYYVDAKVHTFDVNIFSGNEARYPEADYPGGWGTIIVVGMRFGGGDYPLDLDGDGTNDRTTRSAYVVMDVTNPEKPPRLLAELTDEYLGFTTGDLDVLSFRRPNVTTGSFENPQQSDWYLVFGSGPSGEGALKNATSDQAAQLFTVHLNRLTGTANADNWVQKISTGVTNAYVGGITAVDWNSDFQTDMLYIGVVGTGDTRGELLQASVANANGTLSVSTPSRLLEDVDLPFSRAPLVVRDLTNDGYWVYAATGEFMVSEHLLAENIDENWMYGIRVNGETGWLTDSGIAAADMKDISNVEVSTAVDGDVRSFTVTDTSLSDVNTPEDMELIIRDGTGWKKELRNHPELVLTSPTFSGTTLAVSSFSPNVEDDCKPGGVSRLYWLNMFTGLPQTENRNIFIINDGSVGSIESKGDGGGPLSDHTGDKPGIILGGAKAGKDIVIGNDKGTLTSIDADQDPPLPARRAWREVPMSELE